MIASFITASVNAAFNSDYIGSASLNNAYGDWTEAICTSLMIRSNFTNHKFGAQRNCIPQFRYAIRTFNYAIYKLIHSYSPTSTFSLVIFDLTVHDRWEIKMTELTSPPTYNSQSSNAEGSRRT